MTIATNHPPPQYERVTHVPQFPTVNALVPGDRQIGCSTGAGSPLRRSSIEIGSRQRRRGCARLLAKTPAKSSLSIE